MSTTTQASRVVCILSYCSWTLSGRHLPTNSITSTANSSVLTLKYVEHHFEGVYVCSALRRDLAVATEAAAYIQVAGKLAIHPQARSRS